jgi:hypothetical protein
MESNMDTLKELDADQTLDVFASENGPQGETPARWATTDRRRGNSGPSAVSCEATEVLDPNILIRPLARQVQTRIPVLTRVLDCFQEPIGPLLVSARCK